MGLCKCPKKKVTNLFCFEHRVNVCENCLVENHGKCVVQSYLQWLQDSDYNPNCTLCNHSLQDEDCIRLTCYDIFHWRCLNQSMQRLPSNTAPAGYECPICSRSVIPADNAAGPVVEGIRAKLRGATWAQTALGVVSMATQQQQQAAAESPPGAVSQRLPTDSVEMTSERSAVVGHLGHGVSKKSAGGGGGGFRMAPPPSTYGQQQQRQRDVDENKYARRPAFTWLAWVLRSGATGGPSASRRAPLSPRRRLLLVGFLVFLASSTLLYLMSTLGRQAAESDPMLRPELNPNIRVQHHAAVVGGVDGARGGSAPEAI
uniref:RING-type domain-containing protein n=2 Tax=Macrostomum lignano TaxID=282301 RepID=A0A1I8GQ69_9PLAT